MRCFVPVGVDGSMVDNEVGVGWGFLTDDALTGLHELANVRKIKYCISFMFSIITEALISTQVTQ